MILPNDLIETKHNSQPIKAHTQLNSCAQDIRIRGLGREPNRDDTHVNCVLSVLLSQDSWWLFTVREHQQTGDTDLL